MVKKKSAFKSIPGKYKAIGFASLALNAIFIGVIGVGNVLEASGKFDYAMAYDGIERMCSDKFRQTVEKSSVEQGDTANEKGLRLALVDFPCTNNGAKEYYEKGYKEYVTSLGLKP